VLGRRGTNKKGNMDEMVKHESVASQRAGQRRYEALRGRGTLRLGIDIGSTSSDIVVLDDNNAIVFCDYQRTKGRPIETARGQLEKVFSQFNISSIALTAVTGSAGRLLAGLLNVPFVNEVPAQAAAISHLYPDIERATVIEMGGQDTKLIFLSREQGHTRIRDFALNTVCAAGTGSFLDQQADRLGIKIEDEFGRLALESRNVPRMAGRCSVFAKSDMIHLQQQATPMCDILAGLCLALARNLKSNLGCGREFIKPIIFTGGVAANLGVVKALEEVFELGAAGLIVPREHFFTGAIGSVLVARTRTTDTKYDCTSCIEKIDRHIEEHGRVAKNAPRRERLDKPVLPEPTNTVYEHLLAESTEPIEAYLGVDVGSLSTKAVVMDRQKRILAKIYLVTAGRPLEAVRHALDIVGKKVAGKVKICGTATTGSGRYLTGDFLGADVVINEITAQATGAAIVNPDVDTIFEIGGQDSKYISLKNGVVVDFEMNHACAAGTGSFLEEQSQRLGININEEFASLGFKSDSPIKLGERCTVFMESDLLSYQQQGAETKDLVAGLSYSIVANYLNRVVGRRRIGDNICFQGGTAYNKAVWAAFEKVTGKPIMVPDHHEVTGALGAAAIAAEYMDKLTGEKGISPASNFRGFENLVSLQYSVESFMCEHCPNHCEIKKVQLAGAAPLYYGSRCDRYNLAKKAVGKSRFDAFEYRNRKLFELAGLNISRTAKGLPGQPHLPTIGIPMSLISWQLLPLFARFFKQLGFEPVVSGQTNTQTIRRGVESVTAQPCFPVKVAYGHIAELFDHKVDYIFLPSIVSMTPAFPENKHNQLCPYVQSLPYQAIAAFGEKRGETKILNAVLRLGEGNRLLRKTFGELGKKLGASPASVRRAIREAFAVQAAFDRTMKEKGREILDSLGPEQKLFVLISRPYNGCDAGLNLQLPKKLAELGMEAIPLDMLDVSQAPLSDPKLHKSVYWSYGQKILRAAEIIRRDNRLFAIYLSNFSCGPDSFLMTFFKDIMGQKPCLQLEIDEHSADAGVITRLEAFLESLKNYRPQRIDQPETLRKIAKPVGPNRQRTLYVPYMGDAAYGIAACLRSYGQSAEVMPIADEAALLDGRIFTTGKECLPCAITAGEMLTILKRNDFNADKSAFFMPGGSGPCRFGMYSCMHRLILQYAGVKDVPVIAPNQDSSFYDDFADCFNGSASGAFLLHVWAGSVGLDLLHKVILRIRPFATEPAEAQKVHEDSVRRWVQAVEKRAGFKDLKILCRDIAHRFAQVELDPTIRKPRIGIVGEIYVRSHPFANMNIVSRLERLGAACDLAPLAEWIYYTNFIRGKMAWRRRQMKNCINNAIQDYLQHRIEKSFAEPLEEKFGNLAERPIKDAIELARPYIDCSFEGEAVLSVGKIIEYHKDGFGGIVNVMPFTCMPSTIVNTQTRRLSADCGNMPILNISFDGQEDATLTTRLEAFVEQVGARQKVGVEELVVH